MPQADLTVGLLVVIVVILIFVIVVRPMSIKGGDTSEWDCVNRATGDISAVSMKVAPGAAPPPVSAAKPVSPEAKAIAEQVEHFTTCGDGAGGIPDVDTLCRGDSFNYAINEYGAPGMGYKDWAASQSVDGAVVANHAAFVRDRADPVQAGGIITGRTFALPDHESYQPTPWIGIRGRPTRVPVCNPTEVTDDDEYWYPSAQKLVWRSG